MLRTTLTLATVLVTSLAACATDSEQAPGTGGGGKADGELTTLTFDADWNETADGALVAGSSVRIAYDHDRLTECRGYTNGSDAWGIGGFASFDGGQPVAFELSRLVDGTAVAVEPELRIPHGAERVEIWFLNSDRFGCNAYDSNDGANYAFDIEANDDVAVLSFDGDYSESQSGEVVANGRVVLHYDPSRLEQCASSSGGNAKWSITAHYQIDGGAVKTTLVTRADGSDLVPSDPTIAIGNGRELAVWFSATSVYGCNEVDSNLGANYTYSIR